MWLVQVGISLKVDPEFFFRHLDFLSSLSSENVFAQPSLVSASSNVMQFSYITIGENRQPYATTAQQDIDNLRHCAAKDMAEYYNRLAKSIDRSQGQSLVRQYHFLDDKHFAIEQRASICFQKLDRDWTGKWSPVNHLPTLILVQLWFGLTLGSHYRKASQVHGYHQRPQTGRPE
jgi:hypothetical protein